MFGCLTFSLDGNIPSIRPRIRHHRCRSHQSLRQKESGRPIQHSAHVQCSPFIKEHHHSFLVGQTIVKSWPQFWQYLSFLLTTAMSPRWGSSSDSCASSVGARKARKASTSAVLTTTPLIPGGWGGSEMLVG